MVLDYEVRQEWIKNRRRLRKQSKEASDRRKILKLIFTLLLLFLKRILVYKCIESWTSLCYYLIL